MTLQLRVPADRSLFTVGGRTYAWEDVLLAAELRGELDALERQTRQGLACLRRLAAEGEALSAESVRAAATVFRYDRNLLAAEELEAWLDGHGLSVADWNGHLRRLLLRERWAEELEQIESEFPVAGEEVEAALAAEAACTGFLQRTAEQLAEDAALAEAAGGSVADSPDRATLIAALARAAESARSRAPSRAEIEHELAAHALDWIRIEAEALELDDPEAAREAALCVRVDGRTLADVAGECGVTTSTLVLYLEDAEPDLRVALMSAGPGELVGPLALGAGHLVLQLRAKAEPTADDPEAARRAAAVLAARAVKRELRNRVHWHERP